MDPRRLENAKIVALLKNPNLGTIPDNIRAIALTSNLVKLVERILHGRLLRFLSKENILSPHQIGFRPGCSIWSAHVDLESRIQFSRRSKQVCALVTLDVAKAYDSVEYSILIAKLKDCGLPKYIISWIQQFLIGHQFFCSQNGFNSSTRPQTRGVPQGSVLSPILFNILLSSIPINQTVCSYVYADDIAFFSAARYIHDL